MSYSPTELYMYDDVSDDYLASPNSNQVNSNYTFSDGWHNYGAPC